MRALSIIGRITLVRSVLSSIPIYIFSNAILSKTLVSKFKQYFQRFFWELWPGCEGVHLLAWNVICQPLRDRGLGIQSLPREKS